MAGRVAEDARGLSSSRFDSDGAEIHRGLASRHLETLADLFARIADGAGARLSDKSAVDFLANRDSRLTNIVSELIGAPASVVRAIAFDKSPSNNWALGWHQDRTICVKQRSNVDGFGPWTVKQGMHHVQPPFYITAQMVTVRIHLDPVTSANAPLKVALGSHRLGRVADREAEAVAAQHDQLQCLASSGDVWIYSTPILHASERSSSGGHRRVLQLDFCSRALPKPLEWLLA